MGPHHPYGRAAALKGAMKRRGGMGSGISAPPMGGSPDLGGSHSLLPGETTPDLSGPGTVGANPGAGQMTPQMYGSAGAMCAGGKVRK
jgi:hypothetical protein